MYSKHFLKLLHYALLPSLFLGASSIKFNPRTKTFYTTKRSRIRLFKCTTIFFLVNSFFWGRTVEIFLYKGGNEHEYFRTSYAFSLSFSAVTLSSIFINIFQNPACQVMTQIVRYAIYFEGKIVYILCFIRLTHKKIDHQKFSLPFVTES